MANLREFTYPSSDGIHQVHAAEWTPENGAPRAVLQLVHGISEYIMRYDGFARFMADHGFVVVGNDHLGHGGTATGPEEYGFLAEQDGWKHITGFSDAFAVDADHPRIEVEIEEDRP